MATIQPGGQQMFDMHLTLIKITATAGQAIFKLITYHHNAPVGGAVEKTLAPGETFIFNFAGANDEHQVRNIGQNPFDCVATEQAGYPVANIRVLSMPDANVELMAEQGIVDFEARRLAIYNVSLPEGLQTDKQPLHISFDYDGDTFLLKRMVPDVPGQEDGILTFTADPEAKGQLLYAVADVAGGDAPRETTLDSVIAPVPWNNTFEFRSGVDIITGETKGIAVKDFVVRQSAGNDSEEVYQFVNNREEYEQLIKVAVSGKYNLDGITINGAAEFMTKIEYSSVCTTMVADYQSFNNYFDEAANPDDYQLTDKALAIMKDSPASFRTAYGDYFVAGIKGCSRFTATYVCKASSAKSLNEFKASFGVEAPGVFEVNASAEFKNAAAKYGISIDVYVDMYGHSGHYENAGKWSMEEVIKALAWFKKNQLPKPVSVKLKHYNTIVPDYPLQINIAPSVFVALSYLYQRSWVISAAFHSCPSVYTTRSVDGAPSIAERYYEFNTGLSANKKYLPSDEDLRALYESEAAYLSGELDLILGRQAFYFDMKDKDEPAIGEHYTAAKGISSWSYGVTNVSENDAVSLCMAAVSFSEQKSWKVWEKRKKTFDLKSGEPGLVWLITGWEIIPHWTDGSNGGWHKACDRIIGGQEAKVSVESQKGRGCHWTLKVYYVNAADYQF